MTGGTPANTTGGTAPSLEALLEIPASVRRATPIALCVHGVSRNAREHFEAFEPLARGSGWLLAAPIFDAERFPDYQRLGRPGRGGRADAALLDLVDALRARFGIADGPLYLFGHSGGAQFVHRFVMAYPHLVARYALSAPGWFTFPDETVEFPYGLAGGQSLRAESFLRVPGALFVGDRDCREGRHVRRSISLDRHQGRNRRERAARWTAAMNGRARDIGLPEPVRLRELPDAGHSFGGLVRRAGLHERVWSFLSGGELAP